MSRVRTAPNKCRLIRPVGSRPAACFCWACCRSSLGPSSEPAFGNVGRDARQPTLYSRPLPVVLHIVSATVFATLGPLEFTAGFRRRWPAWHRVAGRLLVACGLLVGLTGLWMTLFYAGPDGTGPLLYASRIVFGSAMVVSIVSASRRSCTGTSRATDDG